MNKKYFISIGLLFIGVVATAVISSYGSITGYATVEKSLTIDIIGSSNDENYSIKAYQGETVYSPKIKLINKAKIPVNVNLSLTILPESAGNEKDVKLSVENEFKNETLKNPVKVPEGYLYFYIKHEFEPNANLGNYFFKLDVIPT